MFVQKLLPPKGVVDPESVYKIEPVTKGSSGEYKVNDCPFLPTVYVPLPVGGGGGVDPVGNPTPILLYKESTIHVPLLADTKTLPVLSALNWTASVFPMSIVMYSLDIEEVLFHVAVKVPALILAPLPLVLIT